MNTLIPAPAAAVLRALVTADTETSLERCGEGLRWLRDRGYLYEKSWESVPLVSEEGMKLARSLRLGDT